MSNRARAQDALEFLRRYRDCLVALNTYMSEAHRMCQLLEACNGRACDVSEQCELVAQRDRENSSESEYHRARKRLLRVARLRLSS